MSESKPDPETGERWLKWCREAREGDQQALSLLMGEVRLFFRAVAQRQSWKPGGTDPETSDVAQDCCLKLPGLLHQFRGATGPEFVAWLRQMARNVSLDVVRRGNAQIRGGGLLIGGLPTDASGKVAITADTSTPSKELTRQEEHRLFQEALKRLSADHQEVIRLRVLSVPELTWAEIAKQMQRGEDAVKQLFQRASKELIRLSKEMRGDS
jgi:RNA polymerase sigma factor (sigma-70 family)